MLWLLKIKIREGYVIASIKEWIISIIVGAFIINIVDMILPDTKVKPYINLVCNFIFVFMIISPLVSFFSNNMSLEDTILKKMSDYSKMYVDSYNDLAGKTNNENLSKGYEDGLKSVLQLKLDEYGYELEDLYQIGMIGFIKSVRNFDINFEVKLSTYAVPYILGEVKKEFDKFLEEVFK